MSEDIQTYARRHREGLLSAVSGGFFLILVGVIFVITPNLFDRTVTFFTNFNLTSPLPDTQILLPAPNATLTETNRTVYSAVQQFSLVWGIFLVAILAMRFVYSSPKKKKAENLSDIVFAFGTFYIIQLFLIDQSRWFVFWSAILMLAGISLMIRAIFLAAVRG